MSLFNLRDALGDELDRAFSEHQPKELVEPTEEEKRNGWTAETLTDYLADRAAGMSLSMDPNSLHRKYAERPRSQNSKYNPHGWRR